MFPFDDVIMIWRTVLSIVLRNILKNIGPLFQFYKHLQKVLMMLLNFDKLLKLDNIIKIKRDRSLEMEV